jgi:glycosyltransferase involved in cell wall biosynthesis
MGRIHKVKSLLITGIYPPDIGGPATFIDNFADYLYRNSNEVAIVTLSDELRQQNEASNRNVYRIKRDCFILLRMLKTVVLLRKLIKESDYVLANGLYFETVLANFGIRKTIVAKIVGDPVWERFKNNSESESTIEQFQNSKMPPRYFLLRKLYNEIFKQFRELITPGWELAAIIENWDSKLSVRVIPNGVRCIEPKESDFSYDVIVLTRLVKWKNIDLLIEACAKANLSLAIGGDGPERRTLEIVAINSGAEVEFLGPILPANTGRFLESGLIFCQISSYEGLSYSLLEAMMAGKRIVVSQIKANTDVTSSRTARIVDPNDKRQLVGALKELSIMNEQNSLMSMSAHAHAKKFYCGDKQMNQYLLDTECAKSQV